MKKNDKIQDSPEFKYLEANFEEFVKGMEDDKEYADLKMPDGWEQDFAKTIDDTLDKNERKRRNKIIKRIVGVAAAVVLVVAVGNLTAEQVSGEGLLEMFINRISFGSNQSKIYGTNNEIEFDEDNDEKFIYFSGVTLDEINNQIHEELKAPMFYLSYIPEGFSVEEATYEKEFRTVYIKLKKDMEYIYIFQQKQIDDIAFGTVDEEKKEIATIQNININNHIIIYEGYQDYSWLFSARNNNDVLTINTSISKEECVKVAENIEYY